MGGTGAKQRRALQRQQGVKSDGNNSNKMEELVRGKKSNTATSSHGHDEIRTHDKKSPHKSSRQLHPKSDDSHPMRYSNAHKMPHFPSETKSKHTLKQQPQGSPRLKKKSESSSNQKQKVKKPKHLKRKLELAEDEETKKKILEQLQEFERKKADLRRKRMKTSTKAMEEKSNHQTHKVLDDGRKMIQDDMEVPSFE